MTNTTTRGHADNPAVFWGEISPCEHAVQIYESSDAFLDALEGFAAGGLRDGDGVLVIATTAHRDALEARLRAQHFDLDAALSRNQYLALGAHETLSLFMSEGWPDEDRFRKTVKTLIERVRGDGRRVRAFGEMVAVLWSQGHERATIRLEQIWHELCQEEAFSLFCAYPKAGFTQDVSAAVDEICAAHSRVLPG